MCEPGQMGLCDCEFVCVNQGEWDTVTEFVCVNQGEWGFMMVTVSLYTCKLEQMGLCDCEFVYMCEPGQMGLYD